MNNLIIKSFAAFLILFPNIIISQIEGVWQSEGYGHILDISENAMDLYQATSISNIYDDTYQLAGNSIIDGDELEGDFSLIGAQLVLIQPGGTFVTFNPLNALPPLTLATDDPQVNFDVFWQTYQDWCALFPIVTVDWQAKYDSYSALINTQTTDEELFGYMSELLDNLNDGHSFLDPVNLSGFFDGGPAISPLWDDFEYDMMDLIEDFYIDGGDYIFSNSDFLSYGTINDSIGYLAINGMEGFSDSDNELEDNLALITELDIAMTWLQNTKALIIDVRFNTGGYDSNARIIGSRLTKKAIPVYSKQVRTGGYAEFADSTVFYIEPDGVQYLDRPIAVLTSDGTLSAADIFALLVREIDCVTLIGEATYGALSDNYTKYLPNEWEFGISPERYKSIDNLNFEQLGIPPDIEVIGSLTAFNNEQDNILEATIEQVFNFCNTTSTHDLSTSFNTKLYPNPSSSNLFVELQGIYSFPMQWNVSNMEGKTILSGSTLIKNFDINIESLPSGMYSCFFVIKSEVFTSTFIVP